jgi:hypothetical protein
MIVEAYQLGRECAEKFIKERKKLHPGYPVYGEHLQNESAEWLDSFRRGAVAVNQSLVIQYFTVCVADFYTLRRTWEFSDKYPSVVAAQRAVVKATTSGKESGDGYVWFVVDDNDIVHSTFFCDIAEPFVQETN